MSLKVGIKVWSGNRIERIQNCARIGDITEIMAEPHTTDKKYAQLKRIKTKWVVHCGHMTFGFNPADKNMWTRSRRVLEEAQKAADILNADKIIVHFGYAQSDGSRKIIGTTEHALQFFKQLNREHRDKRIILENLSRIYRDEKGRIIPMSNTPAEMKKLMKKTGYGFCLDFAHSWVVSHGLGRNSRKMIKDFIKLKPKHFHMLDTSGRKIDNHLNLGEGNADIEFFRGVVQKYAKNHRTEVILETPYNPAKNKREVAFMKSSGKLISRK